MHAGGSTDILRQMEVQDGWIHLPSGVRYRYLVLPSSGGLTLETARQVDALRKAGAAVFKQAEINGTPGLSEYPEADRTVRATAKEWPLLSDGGWREILRRDGLPPDFEGGNLHWIHRRSDHDDLYFVANTSYKPLRQQCAFRVAGKSAELWDPLVKYYSGTATYRTSFDLPASRIPDPGSKVFLDLGSVEVVACVTLNGKECGIAWKPPYRVDITHALHAGANELTIDVANTWVNRLVGDEQLPVDADWKSWEVLLEWPDWFLEKTPRDSERYTFTSARHYDADSPLHPAGLLGPVRILRER